MLPVGSSTCECLSLYLAESESVKPPRQCLRFRGVACPSPSCPPAVAGALNRARAIGHLGCNGLAAILPRNQGHDMNRLHTRYELSPSGWLGLICRHDGTLLQGRYVTAWGSRRKVRRALRWELRQCRSLRTTG